MKALLLALSCLLLLAAACGGEADDFGDTSGGSSGSSSSQPLGPDTGAPDTSVASTALALPDNVIVTTDIDLQVTQLRDAYVTLAGFARSHGGFVAEAKLNDDGEKGTAFLRLRVPTPRHDDVVTLVRDLPDSELQREESTAREVTAEYTDLQSRLVNMRATEAQYQELLDRATSIEAVLQVTAKLDDVRGDIESLEGRIKLIEDQSDFASVAVRLSLPPTPVVLPEDGGLTSPVEVLAGAAETSLTVAHAFLNIAIVILVAGLWVIPALLIAALAWRRLRRPLEVMKAWFG